MVPFSGFRGLQLPLLLTGLGGGLLPVAIFVIVERSYAGPAIENVIQQGMEQIPKVVCACSLPLSALHNLCIFRFTPAVRIASPMGIFVPPAFCSIE